MKPNTLKGLLLAVLVIGVVLPEISLASDSGKENLDPPTSKYLRFMAEENQNLTSIWKKIRNDKDSLCEKSETSMECFTALTQKLNPKSSAFYTVYLAILTNLSGAGGSNKVDPQNIVELIRLSISTFENIRLKTLYSYQMHADAKDIVEVELIKKEDKEVLEATLVRLKKLCNEKLDMLEKGSKRNLASAKGPTLNDVKALRRQLNSLKVH